jgi:hypothetical protein
LGQLKRYISFANWLKSTKAVYVTERNRVLTSLSSSLSPVETAYKLNEAYQDIYGVKNSFCQGILNLSEEVKEQFLKSVSLTFNPEFGMHGTNVSTPSFPLEDKKKELELKLKYLYNKRNSFTHRLEQYHSSSIPMADKDGYIYKPNVNPIEEMADMISASRSYQTNVQVADTAKNMLTQTLRLGKG